MSWLSNAWNAVKKGAVDTGHVVGEVASNPIVDAGLAMIPGVGVPVAAAAGGLGRLMAPGGNLGEGLKGAVEGGVAGYAGNALKGAFAGTDPTEGIFSRIGDAIKGGGSQLLGQAGKMTGVTNPDGSINWGQLAKVGGTAASLYGQKQSTDRANNYFNQQQDMRNKMMNTAMADYTARQPMRDAAYASLAKMANAGPAGDIYRPYLQANG